MAHFITFPLCSSRDEVKTPQGRILSVHATDNTDGTTSTTDDNERLVAIQGEEVHPHNETFSRTMDMT